MPFDQLFSGNAVPTTTPTDAASPPPSGPQAAAAAPGAALTSDMPVALQNLGAGIWQGAVRDPYTTLSEGLDWLEAPGRASWLRAIDPQVGPSTADLQAQTQAYLQGPGQTVAGMAGRLGGNVAASSLIPIPGAAAGGMVRGAAAGGLGAALTAGGYGDNPLMAGAAGAVGGGAIGGVTGALVRPVDTFLTNTAGRLGIDLTQGQARGGFLNRLEDLSAPIIGSGASDVAGAQGRQVANVVQRAMGVPETGTFDIPMVNAARAQAGRDMGTVASTMSIDGTAPAGAGLAGAPALPLTDRLDDIYNHATALGTDTAEARAADTLRNQINASLNANGGVMPGADFQRFLASGNTLDRFSGHDNSQVQNVANEVRGALFQAAANTPANPPNVLNDFQAAQLRYKAAMTANDAIKGSGSTEAMTPNALKQAIFRHYSDQFASGGTGPGYDMPDLARMIQAIPRIASSGTAERSKLYDIALSGMGGGLSYLANPHALSAAIGAAAPVAALSAAGRVSRLGAGAVPGGGLVAPFVQYANPLLPRVLGQGVGNLLTNGSTLQPGGTR